MDYNRLTGENARAVRRLVGFTEYSQALDQLGRLVASLTPSELQQVDKFVASCDEYTVYTNLSRRVEFAPSSLTEVADPQDSQASPFKRQGLAWVMGLARVELAAMLATFTPIMEPFVFVNPTAFEMPAYQELLLDGARTHYWSLIRDPQLPHVLEKRADNPEVLSYSRRLVLARSMLSGAIRVGIQGYSPIQLRELFSWKQSLDGLQQQFVTKIRYFLESVTGHVDVTRTKQYSEYIEACTFLLSAEESALKSGDATRTDYFPKPKTTVPVVSP